MAKEIDTIIEDCIFLLKTLSKASLILFFNHDYCFLKIPLSDIMDLRHPISAMCINMLGGEDTHPWSATKVGNHIPATIPVTIKTTGWAEVGRKNGIENQS